MNEDFEPVTRVMPVDMPDLEPAPQSLDERGGLSLALLESVPVSIDVRLGSRSLTLGELMGLKEGSVLTLDRQVGQDVELHLNSRLVGRGQIMAVGDNFGVRITELSEGAR